MLDAYCWPLSATPRASVALHVSTDAPAFSVEVARDGAERRVVWQAEDVPGAPFPTPEGASANGCDWAPSLEIPVGLDWASGYYTVTLLTAIGEVTDAFFVVRPAADAAPADLLLVLSTNTYNAYNDWGGPSLYTGGTRVSFERPMAKGFLTKPEPIGRMMQATPDPEAMGYRVWARPLGLSDWSGSSGWWNWERPFLHWAERNGFTLDVAISHDLEAHPEVLDGHRAFVSVGHDEYWSGKMRDALDAYTGSGGNAAIFSGNTCFWQVRYEDEGRAMTCFKYAADHDPVIGTAEERTLSGTWSDRRVRRPEATSIGLSFTRGGYSRYGNGVPDGSAAFTVWQPNHWMFEGTGLQRGDLLGEADAIVAYEVDGCEFEMRGGVPIATHEDGTPESLEILATAPARLWAQDEQPSRYAHEPGELENVAQVVFGEVTPETIARVSDNHAVLAMFTRPNGGGSVVNVGVTDWAFGIKHADPQVLRVTENILRRLTDAGPTTS